MRILPTWFWLGIFSVYCNFVHAEDKQAWKDLDDAIIAWNVNELEVGDYLVEYEGRRLQMAKGDMPKVAEFSGRTMRLGNKIRTERLLRKSGFLEVPQRIGMLRDGNRLFTIAGFHDDSELMELKPDDEEKPNFKYDVDPFDLIFSGAGVVGQGKSTPFKKRLAEFHKLNAVTVFRVEKGVAAIFELSPKTNFYHVVRFNKRLGWMPDFVQSGVDRRASRVKPPRGDDITSVFTRRFLWKEVKNKTFVLEFAEFNCTKYKETMQIAFDWSNASECRPEYFTRENLVASHRMQDFAYASKPTLRSAIPGVGLKLDLVELREAP